MTLARLFYGLMWLAFSQPCVDHNADLKSALDCPLKGTWQVDPADAKDGAEAELEFVFTARPYRGVSNPKGFTAWWESRTSRDGIQGNGYWQPAPGQPNTFQLYVVVANSYVHAANFTINRQDVNKCVFVKVFPRDDRTIRFVKTSRDAVSVWKPAQ